MSSVDVSVVITTYKENQNIRRLLKELSNLKESNISYEIILLDASDLQKEEVTLLLKNKSKFLTFISVPGLSRTKSLNKIFNLANGELIVRLDARSSISDDYIDRIYTLYKSINAEVVGGTMKIISSSNSQEVVAKLMSHPLCFGGSKSRDIKYTGYVDSIYLGAFSKSFLKSNELFFDSIHSDISEDSDLNYRINKCGGKIYQDSSITVNHYPRENLKNFFNLCFNYGVGRGIFVIKHRNFMSIRQIAPPVLFILGVVFLILGILQPTFHTILIYLFLIYIIIIFIISYNLGNIKSFVNYMIGFVGAHFFWTFGFLISPKRYLTNLKNYD
jgi:succinoglycan biosynthesis protein ExoA